MEDQIDDVQKNIDVLIQQKVELEAKKKFLSGGNNARKGVTSPSSKSRGPTSR